MTSKELKGQGYLVCTVRPSTNINLLIDALIERNADFSTITTADNYPKREFYIESFGTKITVNEFDGEIFVFYKL